MKEGFTVLYAVLISSLLLSIGASIFNISLKQVILSTSASDSVAALYAADAGIECALYWDRKNFGQSAYLPPGATTICNFGPQNPTQPSGIPTSPVETPLGSGNYVTEFQVNLNVDVDSSLSPCSFVKVIKTALGGGSYETKIQSRGQNSCEEDTSKRVERAFEYTYSD